MTNIDDVSSIKDDQTDFSFSKSSVPGFGTKDNPYDDDASQMDAPIPSTDLDMQRQQAGSSSRATNQVRPKRFDMDSLKPGPPVEFNGNVEVDHCLIKPAAPPDATVAGGTPRTQMEMGQDPTKTHRVQTVQATGRYNGPAPVGSSPAIGST